MSANETQVGGAHYKYKAIQPWDYIVSNDMSYLEGCIVKYVSRYRDKNGIEDLNKAKHFLDKLIEVEAARTTCTVDRAELIKALTPGLNELFGMEYATPPKVKKPGTGKRGRPRKAPYGYKANGKPYLRKPRNWKEKEEVNERS
jgi:hypothetical protein